ncbi:hypothetical protein BV133_3249 [Blastochloris viridis]|uniref:SPOR domain-containing protein n=1 Tax=Blastochloris viridis TaxID=1079 RepID=A0A182D7B6_BLAVI|nr:hypothetical protein BV133_3249 [Blastochloris viridis]
MDDDEPSSWTTYAVWGGVALTGGIAVLLAASLFGDPTVETASGSNNAAPDAIVRRDPAVLAETQRLIDAVRALSDDRDRLMARLDQMERTLGDVTAAIPRDRDAGAGHATTQPAPAGHTTLTPLPALAPEPFKPALAQPAAASPAATNAETNHDGDAGKPMSLGDIAKDTGKDVLKPVKPAPAANMAVPQPRPRADAPAESVGTRTEFAIDLGSDASIDGLKTRWAAIRGNNSQLLDGLRPLVSIRESRQGDATELRLVVGPLANASSAARLCAALGTTGVNCQPTQFDGQRLALY